jgi:hypothetical protein
MKQFWLICCNTKLKWHNFSFLGNDAIFSPEDGDSMFLRNFGNTYESTQGHNTFYPSTEELVVV